MLLTTIVMLVVGLLWPSTVLAQPYPYLNCPTGEFAYLFQPNIGWSCGLPVGSSNVNGTFTCPSLTVVNGVVTAATSTSCGGGGVSVTLGIGGDAVTCLGVGGDSTTCLGVGGS